MSRKSPKSISAKPRKKSKSRSTKKSRVKKVLIETPWENVPDDISNYVGFVYLIRNQTNGRAYIGRKYLSSRTTKAVPGKKRRKVTVKESNWRYYTGSCKELNEDLKTIGYDSFTFQVIDWYKTKSATNFNETRLQFCHDVLTATLEDGSPAFYNDNILGRYYRSNIR